MTGSLLCETVTGRTMSELVVARNAASRADLVELRLDGVADLDVAAALHGRPAPVIVTCRPVWEGGRFEGSEADRRRILEAALAAGAELIDVEYAARFDDLIRSNPARFVVSMHDFSGVPADLSDRARAMRATGAQVIKIAVMPARLTDLLPLVEIAREGRSVVIGMGEVGVTSRLLATRFGSQWTYAGNAVAPGQIPTARMLDHFRFRTVGSDTQLFGVVSNNVRHSLSPALHNAALAAAGINGVYVPLAAADFDDFLTFARAVGIGGASVTIPFKRSALDAASEADELTRAIGAANTLRRRGDTWEATNTDVQGFLTPLDAAGVSLDGLRASVLGGGGSARAIVAALQRRGARVAVHARRPEQAEEMARSFGINIGPWPPVDGSWDVLVNCTPLGGPMAPEASPLPQGPFNGRVVYDLTYSASESPLVRDARAHGCLALDGLAMLVAQAEQQFEWWTGRPAPAGVMRIAAERELAFRRAAAVPAGVR